MAANTPPVVGIPAEVKADERRVALTPDGVRELEAHDVSVLVQAGAGAGASITDAAYEAAGAELVADAAEVWARADLVVKVKEPQPGRSPQMRSGLILFTYLHFAADRDLAERVRGCTAPSHTRP